MEQYILRYTKYIYEDLASINIDTATYKQHLHKSFEWFACIQLSIQYNSIFLRWEDIPPQLREEKSMPRDMGIDAWDIEGNRVSQMKLYQGCISWRHFATFLGCCFKFKDAEKILYRTYESQLCPMIQSYVVDKTIIDKTISGIDFKEECKRIQTLTFPSPKLPEMHDIRSYQMESISYLEKGKDSKKNVYLCIPTGCGKTVIILQYHNNYRAETLLVLVPRVVLMEQWGEECIKLGIKPYLIGTGHCHNMDEYTDETIVICVYDSFINIYEQKDRFQRYCIDEGHHIKTPERYIYTELEHEVYNDSEDDDDEEVKEEPLSYMKCIQTLSDTKRAIYISATLDLPEDDSLFYEYKVRQAIEEGYLCDYQFVFPIFKQEYITNEHLAYYLVHKQHESHCIIYASSCKEGQEFTQYLNYLRKGCAGYIDANTSYKERQRLFAEFECGHIQFLVNIRILVEGFNAPHIRSIFFLKVSTSEIFIIQAIGRALRKHHDKLLATIYVPFTHESDLERIQTFINQLSTYDERIKQTIDEKKVGGYLSIEHGEIKEESSELDETSEMITEELFGFRHNLIVNSMGKSDQIDKIWVYNLDKYKQHIDTYNKRPSPGWKSIKINSIKTHIKDDSISSTERSLSSWGSTQTQNYRKNVYTMKNIIIKQLWEEFINDDKYKKYMLSKDELWNFKLDNLKKYIDSTNNRPSEDSKDEEVKSLGKWAGQNVHYFQNIIDVSNVSIKYLPKYRQKKWEEFINDDKYKKYFLKPEKEWQLNLDKVKTYIHKYNTKPTYYKCKNKGDKELGKWLDHQTSNYNAKIKMFTDGIIKQLWEQFIKEYKEHFMTQEEKWIEKLDNCKEFITINNRRPNIKSKIEEERIMAYWISNQNKNYREKCEILGITESLQQLWIPFIEDVKRLKGLNFR